MDSTLPILAVDLGKFNSVLCWFHTSTGELRCRTFGTAPDDLRRELTLQTDRPIPVELIGPTSSFGRMEGGRRTNHPDAAV